MSFTGIFVLSLALTATNAPEAERDPWWGKDKVLHFAVSFTAYNGFSLLMGEGGGSCGPASLSLSLGVLKELYDWKIRKSSFSFRDILFDVGGIALALAIHR